MVQLSTLFLVSVGLEGCLKVSELIFPLLQCCLFLLQVLMQFLYQFLILCDVFFDLLYSLLDRTVVAATQLVDQLIPILFQEIDLIGQFVMRNFEIIIGLFQILVLAHPILLLGPQLLILLFEFEYILSVLMLLALFSSFHKLRSLGDRLYKWVKCYLVLFVKTEDPFNIVDLVCLQGEVEDEGKDLNEIIAMIIDNRSIPFDALTTLGEIVPLNSQSQRFEIFAAISVKGGLKSLPIDIQEQLPGQEQAVNFLTAQYLLRQHNE